MDLHLKGKKVFISGSTKGIGFETARLFLEEGATVIINGRTKKSVESALISLNNDNVSGLVGDFMNDFQVKKLIDHIPDDIDILVNNVGVFRGKEFKDETIEDMQKIIDQLQEELHSYNEHHNLEIASYKSSIKRLTQTNNKISPDTSFSHHG